MNKKSLTLLSLGIMLYSNSLPVLADSSPTVNSNPIKTASPLKKVVTPLADTNKEQASGTFGTVHWSLDTDGTLTMSGGEFGPTDPAYYQFSPWDAYSSQIKKIIFTDKVYANANSAKLFSNLKQLTSIENLSNFDTSRVTNMSKMFYNCYSLNSLDLSNFDTSRVTDMSNMLINCYSLNSLDLSNFDTSEVTNMSNMFAGCSGLNSLDLSNFDTSRVTDMSNMFASCIGLKSLDLSNFDTSKVTNMSYMFGNCSGLKSLDLSNFDTSKVTNMINMLLSSTSIYTLKLGNKSALNNTANLYGTNWINESNTWRGYTSDLLTRSTKGFGDTYIVPSTTEGQPVTVKYVDETGKTIHDPQSLTGNIGVSYDVSSDKYKLSIAGYSLDTTKLPTNTTGTFTDQAQTVTYVYQANPEGQAVTVKYEDETGKTIHDPQTLTGSIGAPYDATTGKYKLEVAGYSLDTKKLPTNGTGTFSDTAQTVTYVYQANPVPKESQPIYRLYNPNTGEHFYTASSYEYNSVAKAGWRKEGIEWNAPKKGAAVYRLYNPNTGEHFYTLSSYEYNSVAKAGWRKEGIAFYSDNSKGVPLYRAFNPNTSGAGSHFYTRSSYEYNNAIKAGWRKEGIAFYGVR